jgi:ribosome assembly protein YihI (activator of Der GTPase)
LRWKQKRKTKQKKTLAVRVESRSVETSTAQQEQQQQKAVPANGTTIKQIPFLLEIAHTISTHTQIHENTNTHTRKSLFDNFATELDFLASSLLVGEKRFRCHWRTALLHYGDKGQHGEPV